MPTNHDPAYPLKGITVLDLTTALAGPLSTLRAVDLGAAVIKVEGIDRPDITRNMAIGGVRLGEMSTSYMMLNRGKRSLALDLKCANGKKVLRE
ncbi:CoA transferase, partial [Roseibium sp.]|uniref:CoA transferase n=1 Tax=Roseibium sp. TaxID=1936156 RepID=UPI003A984F61